MRRTVTPGLFCADLGRLVAVAVKLYGGQYLRALDLDSLESVGIETERLENRWRDLLGFDRARDGSPIEAGIRQKHYDVGVVMREAAMLGEFLGTARIGDPDIRRDDDVRLRGSPFGGRPGVLNI